MKQYTEEELQTLKDKPRNSNKNGQSGPQQPPMELPDKILMYITNLFWLGLGIATIYFTNFFYHFFFSPKLYQPFHHICIASYVVIVGFLIFACFILPYIYKIENVEDYNPKLIPTATAFGVVGVITLIISVWPIWGYTSLLIFFLLWKGFFSMGLFLPKGIIGDLGFAISILLFVFSYKFVPHQGYLH